MSISRRIIVYSAAASLLLAVAVVVVVWTEGADGQPIALANGGYPDPQSSALANESDQNSPIASKYDQERLAVNQLQLDADNPSSSLRVRVIEDESGEPLQSVPVLLDWADQPSKVAGQILDVSRATAGQVPITDETGWVEFELESFRDVLITIVTDGSSAGSIQVASLRPAEVREIVIPIKTRDDTLFYGRIINADDKAPIAGATIRVLAGDSADEKTLLSDLEGIFALSTASWRVDTGTVVAEGYAEAWFGVSDGHAEEARALEIRLARNAGLSVAVRTEYGKPVADAVVMVAADRDALWQGQRKPNLGVLGRSVWNSQTGVNGICNFHALPRNTPLAVTVHCDTQSTPIIQSQISIDMGGEEELIVICDNGADLRGVLRDQTGTPLQGRPVWLLHADSPMQTIISEDDHAIAVAVTNELGKFAFNRIGEGLWLVGPAPVSSLPEETALAPIGIPIHVIRGQVLPDVMLTVDRGLYIRGRVIDESNEPLSGAMVFAQGPFIRGDFFSRSNGDGRFRIGPLPAASYLVEAPVSEGRMDSEPIYVQPGGEEVILISRMGSRIYGILIDKHTGMRRDGNVYICKADGGPSGWLKTFSSGGRFESTGAARGKYAVFAQVGYDVGFVDGILVQPGLPCDEVRVELMPGAQLQIRNRLGQALLITASIEQYPIIIEHAKAKSETVMVVPAGDIVIDYKSPDENGELNITLTNGETRRIEIGKGD